MDIVVIVFLAILEVIVKLKSMNANLILVKMELRVMYVMLCLVEGFPLFIMVSLYTLGYC